MFCFLFIKKEKNVYRNNTTLLTSKLNYITYINKYFCDTGLHSFHSGDFFVHTCTHLHMHAHAYTYSFTRRLIIAMHTLHVKKSHSDCSQSLIKNHPNRLLSCSLLLHHVFVRFVFFMQFKTRSTSLHSNSPFPLSRKSAVICRQSTRNYRNKPYISKRRMLSAVRSNLNYLMLQMVEELW